MCFSFILKEEILVFNAFFCNNLEISYIFKVTLIGTSDTQGTATGDQNIAGCESSPPQIKVKKNFSTLD